MTHRWLTVFTLIAAVLTVSACGGGSSSHSSSEAAARTPSSQPQSDPARTESTAPLSRAVLISKADAICGRINEKIFSNPYRTAADIARLAPQIAAFESASGPEFEALIPPASLASDWQRLLADFRKRATDTAQLGRDVALKDTAAMRKLLHKDTPLESDILNIARRDGFKVCSKPA